MSEPAIDVRGLSRRYGRRWALAELSFELAAGSVLMVTGHNGSGKSTLLRVLATAIRPDRGIVRIHGFDAVREREDVRSTVALLGHHDYLYDSLTAAENLETAGAHRGETPDVRALLERVGLARRGGDPVATFSAGMRKRLSFARVLLQRPRVVLLDEPYGQLDPEGFRLIDQSIETFRREGLTVVIATHQLERVAGIADSALALEAGRAVYLGSTDGLAEARSSPC